MLLHSEYNIRKNNSGQVSTGKGGPLMKHCRLIALDLDGTLLDLQGTISNENQTWIDKARNRGIEVTIATGRPRRLMTRYLEQLNLRVPYVVANGSEVWDENGTLLERHTIKHEDVAFLLNVAQRYGTVFWSSIVDHVFKPGEIPDKIENYQWLKFGFKSDQDEVIKQIWECLTEYEKLEITSSDPQNIEVNPLGISKATGLRKVCEHLKIQPHQVIAMGDGLNDITMMKWSGLGIAMGNAHAQVKSAAGRVTDHHLQDGVARAIENVLKHRSSEPSKLE